MERDVAAHFDWRFADAETSSVLRVQFAVKNRESDPPGPILSSIFFAQRGQFPTYAVPAALR